MGFVHGKDVFVSLDGDDLSAYANNVEYQREADSHDTTTFGKDSKTYAGGLKDGTASVSGIYDSSSSAGPRAVVAPLLGTVVEFIYRPEGTGTGKPQDTVDTLVTAYEETGAVADMVTWTCSLQLSDDVTSSTQA